MSSFPFDPLRGPILVDASISGPLDSVDLVLILDTGATTSLIDYDVVVEIGIDPDEASSRVEFTTAASVESRPLVALNRLSAFGQHRLGFHVIAHPLPKGSGVNGLLGLDFLRGQALAIDFRTGRMTLQ